MLVDEYWKMFQVTPKTRIEKSETGGKDIEYLTVSRQAELGRIARKLLPHADDYLSRKRMKNLPKLARFGDDDDDKENEQP